MPRTIDDQQWNYLLECKQIADIVRPVWDDPQLGREARKLVKAKHPDFQIPDYDLESRFDQKIEDVRRQHEEAETNRRNEQEQERFQNLRKKTQEQYGFTDQAMEDLEKLMVERNIGDYEVAATYLASKQPKTSDATFNDGRWNHDKAPGFAEIAKDPEGWGRSEILKSLYNIQEQEKGRRF